MVTALVTAARHGIGREVARQLGERGYHVVVTSRSAEAAQQVAAELPSSRGLPLDVTDDASVRTLAAALTAVEGGLDVLVSNAAAYVDWSESATGADVGAARSVLETNLFGTWRLVQAMLPLLRRSAHPRIVAVSSGAGSHGDTQFGLTARGGFAASYGVSKAALNALVASLAAELAGSTIVINAVCPGLTATFEGAEQMGARPVADGARSVVWAALRDDDGPSGRFFRDGQPLPW